MNFILAIPFSLRLIALFMLGAVAGGLVNWAVYALAWNRRSISPWSPSGPGSPPRRTADRVPIVGWFGLRREVAQHGTGFWIRPLAVEMLTGLFFAGLYAFELERAAMPWMAAGAPPPQAFLNTNLQLVAHAQYLSHVVLVCLMLAASLVDLDEKTIPDAITVWGTLVALVFAAVYPWSLLLAGERLLGEGRAVEFITLASPETWPASLDGFPQANGLMVALGCWTLWCGGLMPRVWRIRRGLATAVHVFVHRLRVERATYTILCIWTAGAVGIALAAWRAPAANWAGLLTALVGVAAGGGIIWAVRVVGSAALNKEAMGFGDVTLMSMIGAFAGWQACLIIFFMAPFFGLALAVVQWVLHGEHEIPYGPFLCLAALAVVLKWSTFWERSIDVFMLGWIVPAIIGGCLVLLGVLLVVYRLLTQALMTRS